MLPGAGGDRRGQAHPLLSPLRAKPSYSEIARSGGHRFSGCATPRPGAVGKAGGRGAPQGWARRAASPV